MTDDSNDSVLTQTVNFEVEIPALSMVLPIENGVFVLPVSFPEGNW